MLIITFRLELPLLAGLDKIVLKGVGQKRVTAFTSVSFPVLRVSS